MLKKQHAVLITKPMIDKALDMLSKMGHHLQKSATKQRIARKIAEVRGVPMPPDTFEQAHLIKRFVEGVRDCPPNVEMRPLKPPSLAMRINLSRTEEASRPRVIEEARY